MFPGPRRREWGGLRTSLAAGRGGRSVRLGVVRNAWDHLCKGLGEAEKVVTA